MAGEKYASQWRSSVLERADLVPHDPNSPATLASSPNILSHEIDKWLDEQILRSGTPFPYCAHITGMHRDILEGLAHGGRPPIAGVKLLDLPEHLRRILVAALPAEFPGLLHQRGDLPIRAASIALNVARFAPGSPRGPGLFDGPFPGHGLGPRSLAP